MKKIDGLSSCDVSILHSVGLLLLNHCLILLPLFVGFLSLILV